MIKTLIVWFVVILLRKFGRNVDRKEIARLKKVYNQHSTTRIERSIGSKAQPKLASVMVPSPQPALAGIPSNRVSLYNKNGNLIRVKLGGDVKQFSTI
ncbi:MAG: hypothetical protein HQM06_08190 [Magnetococcales bacterium]|nr:hypothetical protein [Magnetococcales bacterium]